MSNYPAGVSDSTYGAPWNEEEQDFEFTIKVKGTLYTDGPLPQSELDEIFTDLLRIEKEALLLVLEESFEHNFEIND
jgi:hypothetical protein